MVPINKRENGGIWEDALIIQTSAKIYHQRGSEVHQMTEACHYSCNMSKSDSPLNSGCMCFEAFNMGMF